VKYLLQLLKFLNAISVSVSSLFFERSSFGPCHIRWHPYSTWDHQKFPSIDQQSCKTKKNC